MKTTLSVFVLIVVELMLLNGEEVPEAPKRKFILYCCILCLSNVNVSFLNIKFMQCVWLKMGKDK